MFENKINMTKEEKLVTRIELLEGAVDGIMEVFIDMASPKMKIVLSKVMKEFSEVRKTLK